MIGFRIASTFACAGVAGLLFVSMPLHAQQTDQGVDESRAIIPRVKIIRVPVNDSSESTETTTTDQDDAQAASTVGGAEGGIETRPLEPLAGSSSGGGIVPREDRVAATDPTVGVAQPLPFPVDPNETPRVRVVTPGSDAETTEGQSETDGEQAAANPEEETGPRWLRKRTRRFKLAPKNTEVLDTTRPAYAVPISPTKTGLKEGARLRQLDKMTGQTVTYDLIIGESRRVDRLLVALDACRSPENNASHGAMAFLKIWDTRNIGGDPDFTGWMFAESPALSALDHPRYDLWVISCTTSEAEVSEVNE